MVAEGLPCTDAAISHWEGGFRLPSPRLFMIVLEILIRLGATEEDSEHLRAAWEQARGGGRKIAAPTKRGEKRIRFRSAPPISSG